jgi:hypothetical protein
LSADAPAPVAPSSAEDRFVPGATVDFSLNRVYYHSSSSRPPLRVALWIDSTSLAAYQRAILQDLRECDYVELVAVIGNALHAAALRSSSGVRRSWRRLVDSRCRQGACYSLYLATLDRRERVDPDPTVPIDCSDILAGIPLKPLTPLTGESRARFPQEAMEYLRSLDLEVIVRFGRGNLTGEILKVARYGVWSYYHSDSRSYRGGPAHLWELIEGNPVSGVELRVLDEQPDAGLVLDRALFQTSPTLSVRANRFAPYWGSTHFVIRALHTVHERGCDASRAAAAPRWPYQGRRANYRRPTAFDLARWLVPALTRRMLRRAVGPQMTTRWRVAWRRSAKPLFPSVSLGDLRQFRWAANPPGHFLADPFVAADRSTTWLFVEDFDIAADKGVIAAAEINADGELGPLRTVLERPYHLSYPHVFAHDGEMFMIPESLQSGAIELYRARRFPDDWVLEGRLVELRCVDATPFERDGRFWMFAAPMPVLGHAPSTLLFSAPALTGPWTLHPASPVASDARVARNAGAVFSYGRRWFRPAQDCAPTYGRALVLHEIEALDAEHYAERAVARLEPTWMRDLVGVHTYNRSGEWETIDGNFQVRRSEVESSYRVSPYGSA